MLLQQSADVKSGENVASVPVGNCDKLYTSPTPAYPFAFTSVHPEVGPVGPHPKILAKLYC